MTSPSSGAPSEPDHSSPGATSTLGFERLLVANRGEIAVRIIATARAMGLQTIAVHSDVDADAAHVRAADEAVRLGGAAAPQSYLDIDAILAAATQTAAQAVHPGYGFLAEHADFARACRTAGLVFVGPPADAIATMGDKAVARRRMAAAGVPVLPGHDDGDSGQATRTATDGNSPAGPTSTADSNSAADSTSPADSSSPDDDLRTAAAAIGFPVMVKASAGGGGTGLRRVADPADLPAALAAVRREAMAAFGSGHLIVERAVDDARHVEVQVLADQHGTVIALGDRDCSVQRRHQKVIEEAPAPGLDDSVRAALADAAVAAARDVDYAGAGTVEFLVAPDNTFAFLEMNTRLQVEHPVTELVTGIDLVEWQLRVAAGERLAFTTVPVPSGHAIEARLYAEDPRDQFLPRTGTIAAWRAPTGPGIRVDSGIRTGSTVTSHYDPLLAKIIAHGLDRDQARRRVRAALADTVVLGVTTNRTFLLQVLDDATFATGAVTTDLLSDTDFTPPAATARDVATVAARLHRARETDAAARSPGLAGWASRGRTLTRQRLAVDHDTWEVEVTGTRTAMQVRVVGPDGGDSHDFGEGDLDVTSMTAIRPRPDRVLAHLPHVDVDARDILHAAPTAHRADGSGTVMAPMHGVIASAAVAVGDTVAAGDELVTLEAMKMEHPLQAPVAGTVVHVIAVGAQVAIDDVVVLIEEPEDGADELPGGPGIDDAPGESDAHVAPVGPGVPADDS